MANPISGPYERGHMNETRGLSQTGQLASIQTFLNRSGLGETVRRAMDNGRSDALQFVADRYNERWGQNIHVSALTNVLHHPNATRLALRTPKATENIVPYGYTPEFPEWLDKIDVHQAVHDFGNGNGSNGSGVHIGRGFVITAGHVAAQWLPEHIQFDDMPQTVTAKMEPGMSVVFLPSRGSYPGGRRPHFSRNHDGSWNDFAILRIDSRIGVQAIRKFRSAKTLRTGERLWVVGDKTGENVRISSGRFGRVSGNNAYVRDIVVEGGFSGGPVIDDAGNLIGIAVLKFLGRDMMYMVSIETILNALLQDARGDLAEHIVATGWAVLALQGAQNAAGYRPVGFVAKQE